MSFRCDFHVHSTVSDGMLEPVELVERARDQGVDAFALTDHDDVSGVRDAVERGRELGVEVIAGIEISVREAEGAREMHVLGLGVDPENGPLVRRMAAFRRDRESRCARMVERLQALGVAVSTERVREIAGAGAVGRPHVARALVEAGACANVQEAFRRYLRRGGAAHVPHTELPAQEAIDLIHAARGIASLAHPRLSFGVDAPGGLEAFVARLADQGLDGLEVAHPTHKPGQARRLRQLARRFDLVETGGSDFHGDEQSAVEIGRGGRRQLPLGRAVYDAIMTRLADPRASRGA